MELFPHTSLYVEILIFRSSERNYVKVLDLSYNSVYKILTTNADDPSLVFGTHMTEEEITSASCPLTSAHTP